MGYAYADSFMARGHSVVICDVRDPEAAVAALQQKHAGGKGKVYGCVCDVRAACTAAAPRLPPPGRPPGSQLTPHRTPSLRHGR